MGIASLCAAVAGCLSDGDDDSGDAAGDQAGDSNSDDTEDGGQNTGSNEGEFPAYDLPTYSRWPPEDPRTRDFVLFGHLNIHHLHETEGEGEEDESSTEDGPALLTLPGYGFAITSLWFYFGMWEYPWNGDLGIEEEPEGMSTEALTMTEGTFIFHGEYSVEVFADAYGEGFETREVNGFTVFEGRSDQETEGLAYAVSESSVVATITVEEGENNIDPVDTLDQALTNYIDEAGRMVDHDDGRWLFEVTGPADMATGFWRVEGVEEEDIQITEDQEEGPETDTPSIEDNPVFDNVDSFISTLLLPESESGVGGDTAAARFAALYPDGEVPSEEELREELLSEEPEADPVIITTEDRAYVAVEGEDELG